MLALFLCLRDKKPVSQTSDLFRSNVNADLSEGVVVLSASVLAAVVKSS